MPESVWDFLPVNLADRLHGNQEIAGYVRELYGFGTSGYVSAMIRGGLEVECGNTTTKANVRRFFEEHPDFTQAKAYRRPKIVTIE